MKPPIPELEVLLTHLLTDVRSGKIRGLAFAVVEESEEGTRSIRAQWYRMNVNAFDLAAAIVLLEYMHAEYLRGGKDGK